VIGSTSAILEMASASGLTLLKKPKNPLYTTTYGTGELIRCALEQGYQEIIVAIGGSATNDGGIGALSALGVVFFDKDSRPIEYCSGSALGAVHDFDVSGLKKLLNRDVKIRVMCDVTNPLTGEYGATHIYGPQKGAVGEILDTLESGMIHYSEVVKRKLGISRENDAGAGAAGGLGFALTAFLNAKLERGIDISLDLVGFDKRVQLCDLVVTGEGSMNQQSVFGKAPVGIAERARRFNKPVIAIVGGIFDGAELVYEHGVTSISPVICRAMELEEALENSAEMFDKAADRMFGLVRAGMMVSEGEVKGEVRIENH